MDTSLAAPPAFDRDSVYLPLATNRLERRDLVAGEPIWVVDAEAKSRPAAADGLVVIQSPQAIAARSAADGSPVWELPFPDPLAVPLVLDHGWLIAGTASGEIWCLRAQDGRVIWKRTLTSPLHGMPVLSADRIYLPLTDARLVALQLATGNPIFERRLGDAANDLLVLDTRAYVGSDDNYFYCVDIADGRVIWRFRTGADVIGTPLVDERRVYFVARDNVLRALDRNSGSQQWRRPLPLRPAFPLLFAGDTVVVSGATTSLYAFHTKDGAPAGTLALEAPLAAPPIVVSVEPPRILAVTNDVLKGATVAAFGGKPAAATPPPAADPDGAPTMPDVIRTLPPAR